MTKNKYTMPGRYLFRISVKDKNGNVYSLIDYRDLNDSNFESIIRNQKIRFINRAQEDELDLIGEMWYDFDDANWWGAP